MISKNFSTSAAETHQGTIWPVAKGLSQKGHKVVILTQNTGQPVKESSQDGVQIQYLEPLAHQVDTAFSKIAKDTFSLMHRQTPFHIVHSLDFSGYLIAKYKYNFSVSVAFDVAATQMSQLFAIMGMAQETVGSILSTSLAIAYKFLRTYYGFDRSIMRSADGIFVISPFERTILERYYLYPDNNIYSVPYGMEVESLSRQNDTAELRKTLKLPSDSKVVVTLTDMAEVNTMSCLLEAFEKVAVKNSNARLIVVGYGPKFREVEYEALSLVLGSRVLFTGAVKSSLVPEYISLADVYINISSRTTGFEPGILEAMAQRKVVIGSEVSPIASLIEDSVDGFLVRPADTKALSTLLNDIFSGLVPTAEIGDRARRKVTDLFDTDKMVDQTLNAYFDILKRTKRYKKQDEATT